MQLDKILSTADSQKPMLELSEPKKQEYHYIGYQKKRKGHTLFSFNLVTKEVKLAEIQQSKDIDFVTLQPTCRPKIVVEKDCIYFQALNKKNFIRKLKAYDLL